MIKKICFSVLILIIVIGFNSFIISAEEVPLINPLNNIEAYEDFEYENGTYANYQYEDEQGEYVKIYLRGDYWEYTVPDIADREEAREDFIKYLDSLAGKIISQSEDYIIFSVPGDSGKIWWGEAYFYNNDYRVNLIKEWNLAPGKTITRKVGGDTRSWIFKTDYEGNKFTTLRISLKNGTFDLSVYLMNKTIGKYERSYNYHRRLYGDYYNLYYLDDIPQKAGEIYWEISDYDIEEPVEISITMEEVVELPTFKDGEDIGALHVKGVAFGRVSVEPASSTTVSHPEINELSYKGDLTPEGDTIFWLPAGYWKVRVVPENIEKVNLCETQLVPVNTGETTVLEIPSFLNSALSTGYDSEGGLEIIGAREMNNQGIITFKLQEEGINKLLPGLENSKVYEGGKQVVINEIIPLVDTANIVLLLDSSGSMKGQMKDTLKTAREFIQSLPDNINIHVFDFDTKPKLLKGNSKKEVLESLKGIKADGATALYDTILSGLDLLLEKDCPNLLLFTDGVDANWDDSGPGSIATQDKVLFAVEQSGVPLYTIGFGPGHDNSILTTMADISGGIYYPADDQTALSEVFNAIKESISQSYQISYNRPEIANLSDNPVISIMIDVSGSMNRDPEEEGCGYRIEKVKNLLRNFILNLPDKSLAQLQSFNDDIYINQILTDNKAELLQALGELNANGGTDILGSVKTAVDSLENVSSRRRILLYVTDAALDVEEEDKEEFNLLLKKIGEENISVIWIGIGMTEKEEVFTQAAELSGGEFLVTEDTVVLENKFNEILQKISEPSMGERKTSLRVVIKEKTESGRINILSDSETVDFSLPEVGDIIKIPDSIGYQTGLPFVKYNKEVKELISKEDIPDRDMLITRRIPMEVKGSNQAMEVKIEEAVFMNRIKGIEVPWNRRILALSMELSNILPEQEVVVNPDGSSHPSSWIDGSGSKGEKVIKRIPYLIPDLSSHLFLNYNNLVMYPISPVTWITEEPLLSPGENNIMINPEQIIRGVCVFIIDNEPMDQASLHFYDTDYGHISLPLVGEIEQQELVLEELPTGTPEKLSEAFSFSVTGVKDKEILQTIEAGEDNFFRIVEGKFTSQVQALLDIKPEEHFYLRFSTEKGDLYVPLNPVTGLLPFGLSNQAILAPGSSNRARFAFQVPKYLTENYPGQLFIELKGDDVVLPPGEVVNHSPEAELFTGDGIELQVNELASYNGWVVADLTIFDQKDGYGTSLNDAFVLVRDDYTGEAVSAKTTQEVSAHKGLGGFSNNSREIEYMIKPVDSTEGLLFGYDNKTVVYDGTNRRVIFLFEIPREGEDHSWTLESQFFTELKQEVRIEDYSEPELLVEKLE
ncbi:MAG: vWA domain-containing protein, partial [Halanaerobiales bacterium]